MYAREGYYGFFKGNGINCAVQAPFTALEFYFYEVFKSTLYPHLARDELSYSQKFISAGLTGITASSIVYPMDVIKTYVILNQDKKEELKQQKSIFKETMKIYQMNGFRGFYKGMLISTVGIAPFIGIRMSTYDYFLFNSKARSKIKEFDP